MRIQRASSDLSSSSSCNGKAASQALRRTSLSSGKPAPPSRVGADRMDINNLMRSTPRKQDSDLGYFSYKRRASSRSTKGP